MGNKGDAVPLRAYIDLIRQLLQEELDRRLGAIDQRFADANRASDKAQDAMNIRLGQMNEFRESMRDQASRMLTREAFELSIGGEKSRADIVHEALAARVDHLESLVDRQRGRQAAYAAVAGGIGALIPILILVITHYH